MSHYLAQTVCSEYPPFTGEFLVKISSRARNFRIDCPPFDAGAYPETDDSIRAILHAYFLAHGTTLKAYWPVVYKEHVTDLPTYAQPVCFIDCTFDPQLAKKLSNTDKYYRCQLPKIWQPMLTYKVKLSIELPCTDNPDTWGRQLADEITPEALADMIRTHWSEYPLQVEVSP